MYDAKKLLENIQTKIASMSPQELVDYCRDIGVELSPATDGDDCETRFMAKMLWTEKTSGQSVSIMMEGSIPSSANRLDVMNDLESMAASVNGTMLIFGFDASEVTRETPPSGTPISENPDLVNA